MYLKVSPILLLCIAIGLEGRALVTAKIKTLAKDDNMLNALL